MSNRTFWSGAWEDRSPLNLGESRGAFAQAAVQEDWALARRLLEQGANGWKTENTDADESDFFAKLNAAPMGHWLVDNAPWVLSGWMSVMSEAHGEEALRKELNTPRSSDGGFGAHTLLAEVLMGVRSEEAQALGQGVAPSFDPWFGLCEALIRRGADPSKGDGKDRSCFNFLPSSKSAARRFGRLLLEAGGDPRSGLERGNSFLEQACQDGESAWIELALLEWGLSSNCGKSRPDALRWACSSRSFDCLEPSAFEALIKASEDPCAADLQQLSPLGLLARKSDRGSGQNRVDSVERLMEAGADPTRAESGGKTPLDLARESGQSAVADHMLAWMARMERQALSEEASQARPLKRSPKAI